MTPHRPPGFYVYCAMNGTDRVACDLHGPFPTRQAVVNWLTEWGIQYRPNGEVYDRAVLYAGELTADESHEPWASAIHYRGVTPPAALKPGPEA